MSKCPNCGGELNYSIKDTKVKCEYCGTVFNPKELKLKEKYAEENETFEGKSFNCTQCGAQLLTFDETAITFCSYCGSQSIIESKMVKVNNPDYIIPFKVTKEDCIKSYKNYLNKALFIPNYMKSDMTVEKFRGIFMPYAVYKASHHGESLNSGEKYSHRSGDYVYYDKYSISAQVDAEYSGISYDLLSKFYDNYSMSIPFDYSGAEEFNKNYLMGYYADTKDVDSSIYDDEVEKITKENSTEYMSKRHEFRRYGCSNPKVDLKVDGRKIGMFPIYFLAIRDKENKIHYAVINGQTGKIAADLPIDFKKFILGTFVFSAIIFAFLYLFAGVIMPRTALIISMIFSVISMIVSNSQLNKIYAKERHLDDEGYQSVNKEEPKEEEVKKVKTTNNSALSIMKWLLLIPGAFIISSIITSILSKANISLLGPFSMILSMLPVIAVFVSIVKIISESRKRESDYTKNKKKIKIKMKMKDKMKYLYKQLIALLAGFGVMLSGTIRDEAYYICAFIIFAIIILAFNDLVKEHNELSSNKLPQLEKRGGDEVGK